MSQTHSDQGERLVTPEDRANAASGGSDGSGSGAHLDGGRPSRRRLLVAGAAAAVLLAAGGVAVARRGGDDSGDDSDAQSATTGQTTANVEKRTLEEREDLDGTLGYGDPSEVSYPGGGTITGLPAIGTIVDRGQTLVEVDGKPIPLLFGDRPLWRDLGPDAENGADIQQLEENLVALGIASATTLTVDQDWTSATTEAVKDWQDTLGVEDTGTVSPSAVIVLPGAVRVAEHPIPVGGQAGGAVLKVTGSTHVITIDLEATRQSLVQVGQPVGIVLPDGSPTTGTITSVGSVATAGETDEQGNDSDPTIEVIVALDDPASSGTLDQAPVTVQVTTSAATDVLAVPVEALLALAEGGYAVEVVQADGTTDLVAVELGAFAEGWVQVTGDVAEGDEVVIPGD